ncbi:hypothetical protein N9H93_05120 [Rhizobiaceae bacterium]|nr:hypothetical protein [Rhizobiaceae bacterium]
MRDHQAEIKNDVHALDRVLGTFGYEGDLDTAMPRQKRDVLFGKGELTRAFQNALRGATDAVPLPDGAVAVRNDLSQNGFAGACPPEGHTHLYIFTVYAMPQAALPLDRVSITATCGRQRG